MYPRIKILIAGDNESYLSQEQTKLKEMGFVVYTVFHSDSLHEHAEEIRPDLILIDYQQPSASDIASYHEILDDLHFTGTPIVFTLSPDDVYLVTRKRTLMKDKRNMIAHTLKDAVKQALHPGKPQNNVLPYVLNKKSRNSGKYA